MTDKLLSQEEIDALLSPIDKKEIDPQQENASGEGSTKQPSLNSSRANDSGASPPKNEMDVILDIPLEITVELGRMQMVINDLLKLGQGSVIDLPKITGETLNILANRKLIAKGELIEVNEKYSLRLTEVISPVKRVKKLNTSS
jgi:flagellar motor switch protein FliN/FliY